MRRFVRSDGWVGITVGAVAALVASLVHANLGEAYLIIFVLGIVGAMILIWPERAQLRPQMPRRPWSRRHRR